MKIKQMKCATYWTVLIINYVPAISEDRSLILPNDKVSKYTETNMWQTLFGDHLTVARARGAIDISRPVVLLESVD